jgi:hypothetical protein
VLCTRAAGVSTVLEREYTRVITLSLTMAGYEQWRNSSAPPPISCVAEDYHQWVPVVIGWAAKRWLWNINK